MARVLKARYFKHTDIIEASMGSNPSYIWRSLMWSRNIIDSGAMWKVGKGEIIRVRKVAWIPSLKAGVITSNISFDSNVHIKDLLFNQSE